MNILLNGTSVLMTKDKEEAKVLVTFSEDWRKKRLVSLPWKPGKAMEQIILEAISKLEELKGDWVSWPKQTSAMMQLLF